MNKNLEEKAFILQKFFGLTEDEARQFVELILKLDLSSVKHRPIDQVDDFFDLLSLLKEKLIEK